MEKILKRDFLKDLYFYYIELLKKYFLSHKKGKKNGKQKIYKCTSTLFGFHSTTFRGHNNIQQLDNYGRFVLF